MRLHKVKISGHYVVKNSDWFSIASPKTIIAGPPGCGKSTILRALQSINPPAGGGSTSPFPDFPKFIEKGGYRRKVNPSKKTAVITVFICDDALRSDLAALDPALLETDRIELGRRLDNSRWTTFVEIASSSRWSEVAGNFSKINELLSKNSQAQELSGQLESISTLKKTDRLKGDIAAQLGGWLSKVKPLLDYSQQKLVEQTKFKVQRAERFKKARELVAQRLPLFIYFSASSLVHEKIDLLQIAQKSSTDNFFTDTDFANFCFLTALGLDPAELIGLGVNQIKSHQTRLESACASFSKTMQNFSPRKIQFKVVPRLDGNYLFLTITDRQGNQTPLDKQNQEIIWLISLTSVVTALSGNPADHNVILLLDEPAKGYSPATQKKIHATMARLAETFQIIYTAETSAMISQADLPYMRVVSLKDKNEGTIISKPATMEELSAMLETA